jgi:acyl carrier protein
MDSWVVYSRVIWPRGNACLGGYGFKHGREVLRMAEINVAETVKRIVVENLERKPEEVTDEARFIEDLGADSLDLTELLMALEEEYNVEIDDEANDIQTVGDAIKYIETKINK